MKLFPYAHATHPDWSLAAGLVLAQLRAQMALPDYAATPSLGLLYLTDHFAPHAQDLLDLLAAELPYVTDWAGCAGVGVMAGEAEYIDEPALVVMLCGLKAGDYRVFSGVSPLPQQFAASTMLLHADAQATDLPELVAELADRTASRTVSGALVGSRRQPVQIAWSSHGQRPGVAGASSGRAVFEGGVSGVALRPAVAWQARLAQGCRPMGPRRRITGMQGQVITRLDGQPALAALLQDAALPADASAQARADLLALLRRTLVCVEPGDPAPDGGQASDGLSGGPPALMPLPHLAPHERGDALRGHEASQARPIIGVDMGRQGLAIAGAQGALRTGMAMTFCQRDLQTAWRDLVRAGTELRAAFEPASMSAGQAWALSDDLGALPQAGGGMAGAVYFSCVSRSGAYFGGPNAELRIVRRALGHVPLVGVFTAGEIAGQQLHTYAGVLLAFGAG